MLGGDIGTAYTQGRIPPVRLLSTPGRWCTRAVVCNQAWFAAHTLNFVQGHGGDACLHDEEALVLLPHERGDVRGRRQRLPPRARVSSHRPGVRCRTRSLWNSVLGSSPIQRRERYRSETRKYTILPGAIMAAHGLQRARSSCSCIGKVGSAGAASWGPGRGDMARKLREEGR